MSIIYVDACTDFSADNYKTMGVEVVKNNYKIDGVLRSYDNEFPLDYVDLYARFKAGAKLESQTLTVEEYENKFDEALSQGENILYFHCSQNVYGGVQNATLAIENLRKKYTKQKLLTIDTLGVSVQNGLICLEGAIQNTRGLTDEEILEDVKNIRLQTAFYFYANSFKNVYGNKINNLDTNYGSMSLIKPIFAVDDDGKIVCVAKANGKNKAMTDLVEYVKNIGENLADYPMAIVHTNCEKDALALKKKITELVGDDVKIWVEQAGANTLSQIGEGALGIAFHCKKRI